VACDAPGANAFRQAIQFGCQTPYQVNANDLCPDPSPPPGPADCVPLQTGNMTGPTRQGLNARYATCPPNNWPNWATGDPRIVQLMLTDFTVIGGSGKTQTPVTGFGAFYITGWDGSTCGNNQPWPFSGSSKQGDIWGYFIKYVNTLDTGGTAVCTAGNINPCVPVLTQ
jgi:hypothetical protein